MSFEPMDCCGERRSEPVHRSTKACDVPEASYIDSFQDSSRQLVLTKGVPEAAGLPQPAAAVYASGTPTPFILISHRRSNSSSSAWRIQSQNTERSSR